MLVPFKKEEKIAMGLLSFMPQEGNVKSLKNIVQAYQENPDWNLYFWKEGEAYIGIVGVEMTDEYYIVRHLAVNPSHQGEGLGSKITAEVQLLMKGREMRASADTQSFIERE